MKLSFFNSLSRKCEPFLPLNPGKIKIYGCGVTVYDFCHLGHARGAVNFDILRRFLEALNYEVLYVKNFTDVDDKIIARANEENLEIGKLTQTMIAAHDQDMESLFIHPADIAPKATEEIPEMIALIEELIEKGFAYKRAGDVFFRIHRFEEYGKLSGKKREDLIAGIHVEKSDLKEDPNDFVLWKSSKPQEPSWQSPWGKGRPGWHIECSAMSRKFLGRTFDIHWGGSDLIFPHHENEIAQSESAHGCTMANYWLHNGMVCIQNEKMSKSLGNFALIRELTRNYRPELIRFYILQTHYRQNFDFGKTGIAQAKEGLDKIYESLLNFQIARDFAPILPEIPVLENSLLTSFLETLAEDLNTPKALSEIFSLVKTLNNTKPQKPEAEQIAQAVLQCGKILGILNEEPLVWFQKIRIFGKEKKKISLSEIEAQIRLREQARTEKDYPSADQIRQNLKNAGIALKDLKHKTLWIYR